MQKLISVMLALALLFCIAPSFTIPAAAADGGEGSLYMISPDDDSIVSGNRDVKIRWSKVKGAAYYWLTIKTESGEKPINQKVKGRSFTVKADTVFIEDDQNYKVYVAAMDADGAVLEGGACWETVIVQATYSSGPHLTYATPAITAPEHIEPIYLPDKGCFYGVLDRQIDANLDLKVKWENTHAPKYRLTIAVLAGEPDYGSTNEEKLETIVKRCRASRSYTVRSKYLADYTGHWLKVEVQPIDPKTKNYGLIMIGYMYIADSTQVPSPQPDPIPEAKLNPNSGHIVIGGVDIGFSAGDYFTKDGQACTCHNQGICLSQQNNCTCIRYVNHNGQSIDLLSVQCLGFSRYVQTILYNEHESNSDSFQIIYWGRKLTAEELKTHLQNVAPGTHIRTADSEKGWAHSMTVVETSSSSLTIVDCNHTARCQISIRTYDYQEFQKLVNSYGGIEYITTHE